MKNIFLDESGDLGFSKSSSKYFIITLMSLNENTKIEVSRIIKKIRRNLIKKKIKKMLELKGNNSSDKIRFAVLKKVAASNLEIYSIILEKYRIYSYLKDKKDKLYNYTANLILNECYLDKDNKICLVVDRRRGGSIINEFDRYIKFKLHNKENLCKVEVIHKSSVNDSCLQVLDFISWAIFRKYESKDLRFYDTIKNKIVTEKIMFDNMAPRG